MKRLLIAGAAIVALGATASAADMPVKAFPKAPDPVYGWSGFYVGANVGAAWGRSDITSIYSCPTNCVYILPAQFAQFGSAASGDPSNSRFTGGVQVGANWQSGALVLGIEVDYNAFRLSLSRAGGGLVVPGVGESFVSGASLDTHWLLTARARVGFTVAPALLVYATGGVAVTKIDLANNFADNCINFCGAGTSFFGASSTSATRAGYAVGGGAEWALNRNWSLKAEYLYLNFGSISTTLINNTVPGLDPNVGTTSANLRANTARVGINYRFGGPVVANY